MKQRFYIVIRLDTNTKKTITEAKVRSWLKKKLAEPLLGVFDGEAVVSITDVIDDTEHMEKIRERK